MGELMCVDGRILHYIEGKTIRELLNKANKIGIEKLDIVNILPAKDCYYMVYYYGEPVE